MAIVKRALPRKVSHGSALTEAQQFSKKVTDFEEKKQ